MRVAIVGVCGSGKSELARHLLAQGIDVRQVAQEHSHVARLWAHAGEPDVLVYLSARLATVRQRGKAMDAIVLAAQRRRLANARAHAHLRLETDALSPADVAARVLDYLVEHAPPGRECAPIPAFSLRSSGYTRQKGASKMAATAATTQRTSGEGRPAVPELEDIARRLRREIIEMTTTAGSGHPSSSMSAIDVIVALYCGGVLRIDPHQPHAPGRDRFILSKGHAAPALYAILAERGFFPKGQLSTLRKIGSPLEGHPNMRRVPGVEASTGSLGQGLSIGLGHALAAKVDGLDYRTYVMTGDGEMDEGQIWEALMAGAQFHTENLTLIVDHNKAQQSNLLERVLDYRPLADKLRAFHWHVEEIDGHDMRQILDALDNVRRVSGRPQAIVAHTIKGKGVSFVEADWTYHGRPIAKDDLQRALAELKDN